MGWRPELGLVRLPIRRAVAASAVTVGLGLLLPTAAGATALAAAPPRLEQATLATSATNGTPIAVPPTVGLVRRSFPFHRADLALLAIGSGILMSLAACALRVLGGRPLSAVVGVGPARLPAPRTSRRPELAGSSGRTSRWS